MQLTSVIVNEMIENAGLSFELEKVGKKWICDNQSFDNLKQVVAYVERVRSRSIHKGTKQGEDAIQLDRSKVMVLQFSISAPIPQAKADMSKTKEYTENGGMGTIINDQLRIEPVTLKNGKTSLQLPEELRKVSQLRQRIDIELKRLSLPYSINANRVVSVHHVSKINEILSKYSDELQKIKDAIPAKLPDWEEESKRLNLYIDGKFPSSDYFDGYTLQWDFLKLGETFNFESEVKQNAVGMIQENLVKFLESLQTFLNSSGEDKRTFFKESYLEAFRADIEAIKEQGLITGESLDQIFEKAEKVFSTFSAAGIREAKKKINKGVVVPSNGKGRKAAPVTQDDISECERYIEEQKTQLAEIANDLQGLI